MIIWQHYFLPAKDYALVLPACLSHVVGPAHSSVHTVVVLASGEEQDQENVFVALPKQRKKLPQKP